MTYLLSITACALLLLPSAAARGNNCDTWFAKTKIKTGPDCLLRCTSSPTDLGSFTCPSSCDTFCKTAIDTQIKFKVSDIYPGLTPAERAIAAEKPIESLKAYRLSWRAEEICLKDFTRSDTNDGSDACRHFVWAVLLTKEINPSFAQQILDAHKQEPTQEPEQKAMDLANNQRGVTFGSSQSENLSDDRILKEFRDLLSQGKLIVLKKGSVK